MRIKRILSILLVVAMLVTLFPTTALAGPSLITNVRTLDENGNSSTETGGSINVDSIYIPFVGSYWSISANASSGYFFDHWEGDLSGSDPSRHLKQDGNKTVTAVFRKYYTLSLSAGDNGTLVTPGLVDRYYKPNDKAHIGLANPTSTDWYHYEFAGWRDNNNPSAPLLDRWAEITMNANKSYTAIFKGLKNWKLTVVVKDNLGGTLGKNIDGYYEYGSEVDLRAADPTPDSANGYRFDHWEEKIDGRWKECGPIVTSGEVNKFWAVFTLKNYTVTYKDNQGDTLGTETVQHGSKITKTADSFTYDSGERPASSQPWVGQTITDNTTIKVNTEYKIIFNPNGGTITSGNSEQWVAYGHDASEPTVQPPTGKHFASPKWDDSFTNVTAAKTVKAQYEDNIYTVSFKDQNGNDFGTPQKVAHGQNAVKPALPDGTRYDTSDTAWENQLLNVTGNREITVALDYKVTFNPNGGTVTSGDVEQWVHWGEDATPPSVVAPMGYRFAVPNWNPAYTNIKAVTEVVAQWQKEEYTVTYNPGTVGTLNTGTSTAEKVLFEDCPKAVPEATYYDSKLVPGIKVPLGYKFLGWSSDGGSTILTKAQVESTAIKGNITYVAQFEYKGNMSLTINVVTNGVPSNDGGVVTSSLGLSIPYPQTTKITQSPKDGYKFVKYNIDSVDKTWSPIWIPMDGHKVLTAYYESISYTVSYDANGGDGAPMADSSHLYGIDKKLSKNTYTLAGCKFDGWATSPDGPVVYVDEESVKNLTTVDGGKVTLYAKWSVTGVSVAGYDGVYDGNNHSIEVTGDLLGATVTYSTDGVTYSSVIPEYKDVTSASGVEVFVKVARTNAQPFIGSAFVKITKAPLKVTADNKTIIYGGLPPMYTATFDGFITGEDESVLGGTLEFSSPYVMGSKAGTYPITPSGLTSTNYDIKFLGGVLTVNKAALTVTAEDKAVTYLDAPPAYTAKYTGFVSGDTAAKLGGTLVFSCSYAAGSAVGTYKITPSGLTSDNYNITFVDGTLTVNTLMLTVTFQDYDGTVLGTSTVPYGTAATPPANPTREGYTFTGWSASFNNVTSALTVTAQYAINTYTVRFFAADGVTEISSQTVNFDGAAALPTALRRTGYAFDEWVLTGDNPAYPDSLTHVKENINAVASYIRNGYTVTFVDYDGSVIGTDGVLYGQNAVAPVPPTREGYTFIGWDREFNPVTGNVTVTAQYEINRYTVRFVDYDGTVIDTQTVDYNTAATAPPDPTREGYTFTGWDTSFDAVTSDLTVTAQYEPLAPVPSEPVPEADNTIPDEPVPATGGNAFAWWWIAVIVLGAGLLFFLIFFVWKRRRKEEGQQ